MWIHRIVGFTIVLMSLISGIMINKFIYVPYGEYITGFNEHVK